MHNGESQVEIMVAFDTKQPAFDFQDVRPREVILYCLFEYTTRPFPDKYIVSKHSNRQILTLRSSFFETYVGASLFNNHLKNEVG